MAKLTGYRRLAGAERRYSTPSGDTISYRQYRNLLDRENLIQRLDAVDLANRRRQQRQFNDIIKTMSNVQAKVLDVQIAIAEERGDEGEAHQLRIARKHVKSTAIKSDLRKHALQDLNAFGHQRRNGRYTSLEAEQRTKSALMVLGRREGIPDWVPVGASDRYRKGDLRRARIPAKYRPMGTRASKG